jgi:transcriptional regulator with XRE-family HTH domain
MLIIQSVACYVKQQQAALDIESGKALQPCLKQRELAHKDLMNIKLDEMLRTLRRISGAKLREVEKKTGVSNAYLSQLETGTTKNPSPQVLHALASFYEIPYESLMEAAGYLKPATDADKRRIGAAEAALMSAKLSPDEEARVVQFIEFLRSQRRANK